MAKDANPGEPTKTDGKCSKREVLELQAWPLKSAGFIALLRAWAKTPTLSASPSGFIRAPSINAALASAARAVGCDVPATPTAPAFTVDGFSDVSFSQSRGWALRASAKYPVTRRWSMEPYYVRWHVSSSPVNDEMATFTVNNVTAREQLGAYEPLNVTSEFGVRLGFHF